MPIRSQTVTSCESVGLVEVQIDQPRLVAQLLVGDLQALKKGESPFWGQMGHPDRRKGGRVFKDFQHGAFVRR